MCACVCVSLCVRVCACVDWCVVCLPVSFQAKNEALVILTNFLL